MAEGPYLMGIDFGTGGVARRPLRPRGNAGGLPCRRVRDLAPAAGPGRAGPRRVVVLARAGRQGRARGERRRSRRRSPASRVDATASTVLAIDDNDRPLRPAIMWMDVRASDQAERIAGDRRPGPQVQRLRRRSRPSGACPRRCGSRSKEPETWKARRPHLRVRRLGDPAADRRVGRLDQHRRRQVLLRPRRGRLPREPLRGGRRRGLAREVPAAGARPGRRSSAGCATSGAEELGLKAGHAGGRGRRSTRYVGALGLGVVEPGQARPHHRLLARPASARPPQPIHGQGFWGAYTDADDPGPVHRRGRPGLDRARSSRGSRTTSRATRPRRPSRRGVDPYEVLNELAARRARRLGRADRARLLPGQPLAVHRPARPRHDLGPVAVAHARATCSAPSSRASATARSTSSARCAATTSSRKLNVVSGGPTKSELWMQMHADVSNVPISFTKVGEGPVLGSAMLAAVGRGRLPRHPDRRRAHGPHRAHHRARPGAPRGVPVLRRPLRRDLPERMKDPMHKTARHVAERATAAPVQA